MWMRSQRDGSWSTPSHTQVRILSHLPARGAIDQRQVTRLSTGKRGVSTRWRYQFDDAGEDAGILRLPFKQVIAGSIPVGVTNAL